MVQIKTESPGLLLKLKEYQDNPSKFFQIQWPAEAIYAWQERICESVVKNKRTYVRACNSSSKTHTVARLVVWWLNCFVPSIVVSTATTYTQIESVLWGQIRGAYNKARFQLLGKVLPSSPEWKIGDSHYGIGLSVKEKERIQGHHTASNKVLVIIDEGSGVPDDIYEAIEGLLTGDNTRLVVIGNPLRPSGKFYQAFKTGTEGRIHIDGEEVVKYAGGCPGLISQSFLDEQRQAYEAGNNPFYLPRCRGEFPDTSIDTVLNLKDVETAVFNPVMTSEVFGFFAIDWAAGGDCETVIQHWFGGKQCEMFAFSQKEPEDTIGRLVSWIRERKGSNRIFHDNCGIGKICGNLLKNSLGEEYKVGDINNTDSGDDVYENLRSKMWFYAREILHTGGIALLNDSAMQEQLLTATYFHNRKGKILIVSKPDIKKDYGINMDRADCTIYALEGYRRIRAGEAESLAHKKAKIPWMYLKEEQKDNKPGLLGIRKY